ncbi:MAG: hypothetical protein KDB53_15110 [Planctomycetes bacterium]|nr:hypothetical protein [Planctomycetota bacterium]
MAQPQFIRIFPIIAPMPVGLTIVLQAYAYDPGLPFPLNILVSPPRMLSF